MYNVTGALLQLYCFGMSYATRTAYSKKHTPLGMMCILCSIYILDGEYLGISNKRNLEIQK